MRTRHFAEAMFLLPAKRRRLQGKQSPPEGVNTREARMQVQTLVRDAWVARRMVEEGSHGHARRNVLRVAFSNVEQRAPLLQAMWGRIPVHLMAAAGALLAAWRAEQPIVMNEQALPSYRGSGTMFRYSGSWSKILDDRASAMLAEGAARIADVCRLLQDNADVATLWGDFQRFAEQLRQSSKMDRLTLACELHTTVSLETLTPSIHFHLMFDSRCLAASAVFLNVCPDPSSEFFVLCPLVFRNLDGA